LRRGAHREVPGNPSMSLTNAISRISDFVAGRFSLRLDELTVFEVWPKGAVMHPGVQRVTFTDDGAEKVPGYRDRRDPDRVELDGFTGRPQWWSSKRRAVEKIVGSRLPELPPHEELYAAVKAMGGGTRVSRSGSAPVALTTSSPRAGSSSTRSRRRTAPGAATTTATGRLSPTRA